MYIRAKPLHCNFKTNKSSDVNFMKKCHATSQSLKYGRGNITKTTKKSSSMSRVFGWQKFWSLGILFWGILNRIARFQQDAHTLLQVLARTCLVHDVIRVVYIPEKPTTNCRNEVTKNWSHWSTLVDVRKYSSDLDVTFTLCAAVDPAAVAVVGVGKQRHAFSIQRRTLSFPAFPQYQTVKS